MFVAEDTFFYFPVGLVECAKECADTRHGILRLFHHVDRCKSSVIIVLDHEACDLRSGNN
jgi:hypothetical protein